MPINASLLEAATSYTSVERNVCTIILLPTVQLVWREVNSAAPVPAQSRLEPPSNSDALVADLESPAVIMLHTCDKYGNPCSSGGLRIAARLNLVKQNANDISILSPNNHTVVVDDLENGTYSVSVALLMALVSA